jgi:hypothetical protein
MKTRVIPAVLFPMSLFFLLLFLPSFTGQATLSALIFVVKTVFPSLFIFLCLSSMLTTSPAASILYRFPFGVEATVWIMGVLCGFPVGARCALRLYEAGNISKTRAEFLCGFSNLASAPFLVGAVGNSLFKDPSFGAALTALQGVGSLLSAVLLFGIYRPKCHGIRFRMPNASNSMASHVGASAHTMLEVGGMLIFFGVAAEAVRHCMGDGPLSLLVTGLLEFSAGCREASLIGGEMGKWMTLLFVGFGGLCVFGQISAVTKGKLSMKPYLLGKLLQTAWMALLFLLLT